MQGALRASAVEFVSLQMAAFCVQCEMITSNNTPRCLACGSAAILSLSRVLGGSLRGQQTAHLIEDAELDRMVRSLLTTVPTLEDMEVDENGALVPSFSSRHHMRVRNHNHNLLRASRIPRALINAGELDLEPGISIIAEKAQSLTGATGSAIALRQGNQIVCRARTGRTAPDLGMRLQSDRGISAECVRTGEVLLCNDAESNPNVDAASARRLGVRSILVAPLRHFKRTLGVFEVLSSTPYAFDNNDVATMQFLSGMMVAAMSRLASAKNAAGS